MRHHLRFLCLCIAVAMTAGCSDSDQPTSPSATNVLVPIGPAETCASIGDRVWIDTDCDGFQDKNDQGFTEPGAAGVTVNLYTCEGQLVATTTTDATGFYLFANVEDTSDYKVCVVLPPGYTFAPRDAANDGTDSDIGPDGCSGCLDVSGCGTFRATDAGLCPGGTEPCASIGDRVWLDLDCDGFQDKNDAGFTEPGVPDVTVNLYTCEGQLVGTTTTDANGAYLFSNVDDALDYYVCFVLPVGYSFAPKDASSDGTDSDVGADGCTDCFGVGECEEIRSVDAGLCREEAEGEGCSPGFWKNHYTHWGPTGYSPDDVFDDVFGCTVVGDGTTLGDAIHIEQTHNQLAFQGVAALLNASHPGIDNPTSPDDVKAMVCAGDKDGLTAVNIENCPLSGGNTNGGGGNK